VPRVLWGVVGFNRNIISSANRCIDIPAKGVRCGAGATLVLAWTLAGCVGVRGPEPKIPAIRIDPAGLASSPPVQPERQWQVRLPMDTQATADWTCRLCDQYDLIQIRTPQRWRLFCDQTNLTEATAPLDFTRGSVVGLIARVGEPADGGWPTAISEVRMLSDGTAWVRSQFRAGLYRPVLTDSYCNLIYVKGLRRVFLVEINRRAFLTSQ